MRNLIFLEIPGKPIAKKRPRFVRRGKYVGAYNVQLNEEGRFILEIKNQLESHTPFSGPCRLSVKFNMPIPKSTSKKRRALMIDGEIKHTKTPDVDNLLKFVCDCLNGIVWKDDSQVYRKNALKMYAENPSTEVVVRQISE